MKAFLEEFKKFALRGNVMDMAVGIIVGAAFTAIVTSLVDDLLSPLLGLLVRVNFSDLKVSVLGATFAYGNFIMAVINFLPDNLCCIACHPGSHTISNDIKCYGHK